MFVDGMITGDVGDITLGERLTLSSGFISVIVVVKRAPGVRPLRRNYIRADSPKTQGPGAAVRKVEAEWNRWPLTTLPIRSGSPKGFAARLVSGWAKSIVASR